MPKSESRSKRIVKNTLMLYIRMLLLMAVGVFTSRVMLQALGVENYGIYNVVGGFVALFHVLTKSLSSATSRFLNFEMGTGNKEKLRRVFSTTVSIMFLMSVIIAVLAEAIGIWYVNNKMVIPPERLYAANWCFHLSVLSFCFGLITVPYNAAIIAHEKMSVYAYISIFDGIAKLLICYMVMVSPIDRLVMYALLMFAVTFINRSVYQWYCHHHFEECKYQFVLDKPLLKDIFGYTGWNIIGATSAVLRNQGGNVLINLFYGPTVNAARGVANQVLHIVTGFVHNFVVALNPQITQSYASGDRKYMMTLIYQGARLSYFMILLLGLPIFVSTDYLLHLWLKTVPEYSALFAQLTLIFNMVESISNPLITAQLATGKIRNYQIAVGGLQLLVLPVDYVILKWFDGPPQTIFIVATVFSFLCLCVRLYMLRGMIHLNVPEFIRKVILNVLIVTVVSAILPIAVNHVLSENILNFIIVSTLSLVSASLTILYIGCDSKERGLVYSKVSQMKSKLLGKKK